MAQTPMSVSLAITYIAISSLICTNASITPQGVNVKKRPNSSISTTKIISKTKAIAQRMLNPRVKEEILEESNKTIRTFYGKNLVIKKP